MVQYFMPVVFEFFSIFFFSIQFRHTQFVNKRSNSSCNDKVRFVVSVQQMSVQIYKLMTTHEGPP